MAALDIANLMTEHSSCALKQASMAIEERSEWELFYACPSLTAPAFLEAIVLHRQSMQSASPEEELEELRQLADAMSVRLLPPSWSHFLSCGRPQAVHISCSPVGHVHMPVGPTQRSLSGAR